MYQEFRNTLAEQLKTDFGHDFADYTWDALPSSYPCDGSCMADHVSSRAKRQTSPSPSSSDPAVLYLPLGGGGSKGCPSMAESAVVGISQMTFLWTVMSVFNVVANVVANINNNQNNRNNNNNNLNINKYQHKIPRLVQTPIMPTLSQLCCRLQSQFLQVHRKNVCTNLKCIKRWKATRCSTKTGEIRRTREKIKEERS